VDQCDEYQVATHSGHRAHHPGQGQPRGPAGACRAGPESGARGDACGAEQGLGTDEELTEARALQAYRTVVTEDGAIYTAKREDEKKETPEDSTEEDLVQLVESNGGECTEAARAPSSLCDHPSVGIFLSGSLPTSTGNKLNVEAYYAHTKRWTVRGAFDGKATLIQGAPVNVAVNALGVVLDKREACDGYGVRYNSAATMNGAAARSTRPAVNSLQEAELTGQVRSKCTSLASLLSQSISKHCF